MSTHFPDDDPLAARLRDALSSEAAMVTPSDDGLQQIRDGIAGADRPWWRHPAVLAVAAAVVLGMVVGAGVAFLGGGDDGGRQRRGRYVGQPHRRRPASRPSRARPRRSSESSTPIPVEGDVYVYYVMDDGQAPRLYREQRPNPGMDPVTAAVSTLLAEPAVDPDYSSPWPAGTQLLRLLEAGRHRERSTCRSSSRSAPRPRRPPCSRSSTR